MKLTHITMLFFCLLVVGCFLPPTAGQPAMGKRYLGMFESSSGNYKEVIYIYEEGGISFEHSFFRDDLLVLKETGDVEIEGYSVKLSSFTEFIDSETGTQHAKAKRSSSYPFILLREGNPEADRLLPFSEHPYYLQKVSE